MLQYCFYWLCTSTTSDGGVTTTSTWDISCCLCFNYKDNHLIDNNDLNIFEIVNV